MNPLASELAAIAFFAVVGWAALWPVRARLGAVAYHLAAIPVGLLSAPLAGGVSTVTDRPLDMLSAVAGGLLLIAALWAVQRGASGRGEHPTSPVGLRSFVAAASTLGVFGVFVGLARYTVSNNDSFISYWPLGVELSRGGAFTATIMASRSALLPSMNAIHATLGSDWAYVIYPVLGATLALWLAMTLWVGPLSGAGRRTKTLVAGGAFAFLIIEPSFLFHSFFVHSHMISAVYLLMSLTCIWLAVRPDATKEQRTPETAHLILAGVFAAGLTLSRPDGLAYLFVPVVAAIAALTVSKVRRGDVMAFFAPLLFIVLGVYGAAYARLGMWPSTKLSGRAALAILGILVLSAAGPWMVETLDRFVPWRIRGERFLAALVSLAGALMVVVFALKWESARAALATTGINLFEGTGGYNYLWYGIVIILALSVLTRDALRPGSWTRSSFLAIVLFFIIAGFVHGTSHAGRLGVGDSLNRVVFHAIPLVVWYAGAVVARILSGPRDDARAEPQG